uniref:Uncharacterized protein n=1 Tax=Salix viminalis TaxID=40686 RepID=A0A6N2M5Z5_SALVM
MQPSHLVAGMIVLKGLGGFLFVFGNPFGAYLLLIYLAFSSPILYDFYNYEQNESKYIILLNEFLQGFVLTYDFLMLFRTPIYFSRSSSIKHSCQETFLILGL